MVVYFKMCLIPWGEGGGVIEKWQKVEQPGDIPFYDSDLKSILSLTYDERILYRILRQPSCIIGGL
ncbi:hypothetical protein CVE23_00835 [Dickeya fangzhongdai]|uniref:Uncharacterized protein n=1 Tax=Dickeya fangzhongdai TaxID=1778540 RepID=A0A2K8QGM0_9GAMM|nr:hypothetical protein CVE23_00835 [Dickeya fangzhongdai]